MFSDSSDIHDRCFKMFQLADDKPTRTRVAESTIFLPLQETLRKYYKDLIESGSFLEASIRGALAIKRIFSKLLASLHHFRYGIKAEDSDRRVSLSIVRRITEYVTDK